MTTPSIPESPREAHERPCDTARVHCCQCGFTLRVNDDCPQCKDHRLSGWIVEPTAAEVGAWLDGDNENLRLARSCDALIEWFRQHLKALPGDAVSIELAAIPILERLAVRLRAEATNGR